MKIMCDVCQKSGASVFCAADEAALCDACDYTVHHANKLAGKHHRFSLLPPSPNQIPLCDICQEKKAFLFCQQDRAILCRNCDSSIHKANEHTQKHNRFLLTGIKLSADSSLYVPSTATAVAGGSVSICHDHNPIKKSKSQKPVIVMNNPVPVPVPVPVPTVIPVMGDRSSSMSEYLMEMLPGWPVEDLLDSSSPSDDFCKTIEPLWDEDIMENQNPFLSYDKTGIWVPQSPVFSPPTLISPYSNQQQQQNPHSNMMMAVGMKNQKEGPQNKLMGKMKKRDEGYFIVPEISSQSNTGFKRFRTNLW
ncbi:B-box zinc finger protein 21-like [Impatiens glandulifera]|uniref:B-box zinc finger protein 21-like n=1 Tax=Impatiens glandulifera TaxID=253017 RepID=UPI001FB0BA71|nr:B-box zinc finger protein 21-like [Impatiens glandulifera]